MANFSYEEYESHVIVVVVLFVIYDILGFIGNSCVLFIFGTRYPKNRFRLLVLALSAVDFTSCCTTVPLETVSTYLYFDPPSRGLCKAKNFFVQLTGLSAMYMLFVTSVYKFRMICQPDKRQLTSRCIIILCCIGIIASLGCAVPAGILWDINNHTLTFDNKTDYARICEVHEQYRDTLWPQIYRHVLSGYNIFLLATIVLYFFVAKKTIAHYRMMKKYRKTVANERLALALKSSNSSSGTSGTNTSSSGTTTTSENLSESTDTNTDTNPTMIKLSISPSNDTTHRTGTSKNQQRPIKISKVKMMVIIAGTFSVTFIMALTFGYVFALRDLQDYKSVGEYITLFSCYRFYFINYCMNPVVYFIFDRRFRAEMKKLIGCYHDDYETD